MVDRTADYRIGRTTLSVTYADITKLDAEALVSSDDTEIAMAGGVSRAILNAAGERLTEEVRKHVPLKVGEVAVTSAGGLPAKYVLHTAMIDHQQKVFPDETIVMQATQRCLELADALRIGSIAFPALGTGVGQFPFQRAAEAMTRTLTDYLSKGSDLERVTVCLFGFDAGADQRNHFFERAAGLAAVAEQGRSLQAQIGGLQRALAVAGRSDLAEEMADLAVRLESAGDVLRSSADSTDSLSALQEESQIGSVTQDVVTLSTRLDEQTTPWSDQRAEGDVLRTKLQGIMTQLTIQTANLNKLEIQKAKHGIDVPLIIENSIDEMNGEIAALEAQAQETRQKLSALVGSQV